jgi:hypothetical protein
MKKNAIGLGRLIERGERELKNAKRSHQEALSTLREACPHATAVEISRAWIEVLGDGEKPRATAWRFCLQCGASEHGTSYVLGLPKPHFQFRLLEKSKLVRKECFRDGGEYAALLEIFHVRLHEKGFFDEFDDAGAWRGKDAQVVLGED